MDPRKPYLRGGTLHVRYIGGDKKEVVFDTGLPPEDVAGARAILKRFRRQVKATHDRATAKARKITVATWIEQWLAKCGEKGHALASKACRLRKHVRPYLGRLKLADVDGHDIEEMFLELRLHTKLAPRSLGKIYDCTHALFRMAKHRGLRADNPVLPKSVAIKDGTLPVQKPVNRDTAAPGKGGYYFPPEIVKVCGGRCFTPDVRVMWTLLFLTGLRFGEAAALRWEDWKQELPREVDPDREKPLGSLEVTRSWSTKRQKFVPRKTEIDLYLPVHPRLERLLVRWRAVWVERYGREPDSGKDAKDLLVPNGGARTCWDPDRFGEVRRPGLASLGVRALWVHHTRHTFATSLKNSGADHEVVNRMTHPTVKDASDGYWHTDWSALSRAILCWPVEIPEVPLT